MKPSTTSKLAKIIPLLASDKDGEVLGAVQAIRRALEAEGADLHGLAAVVHGGQSETWEYVVRPRPGRPFNFADFVRKSKAIGTEDLHPDASALALGLPISNPDRIDSWRAVADYCLDHHRRLPRGKRYRFLRPDEIERLKNFAVNGHWPTNRQARWMETVLARCHQARDAAEGSAP